MSVAATEFAVDGWETTPLKAEVALKNGRAYNAKTWKTEGYPIIRIQNLKDPTASFNFFQGDPETQVPVRRGDLLFSWSGSKGTSFGPHIWRGQLGVLNQHIFKVILNSDSRLDQNFLYFALKFLTAQIEEKAYGLAALVHVRKGDLEATPIPLPPPPEQKKIAHILSTVQRAIEAQERIIQTTTELKKALMHKLFTEGLRNEPQKQTEIGPVPESWKLLPIGDLFETQLGKMLSQKAKIGDSPKAYLRNKNVQWGRIDTDDLLRMDFNDREADKFRLRKGDLLICEGGEVGRAALWDGSVADCYYQKALHRLRPKTDQITNEFMVHWMMFAFLLTNTYGVTGTRTTIAHLPEIKLKPLLVPVPSPDQQAEIVRALETVDQKHAVHQEKFSALQDLFRTLLKWLDYSGHTISSNLEP
jgi:type I restriction enzyme S subunit